MSGVEAIVASVCAVVLLYVAGFMLVSGAFSTDRKAKIISYALFVVFLVIAGTLTVTVLRNVHVTFG